MRGDWKDEAMQYRHIDRAAQAKAENEIALSELRALQVNGFDPIAAAIAYPKLVAALKMVVSASHGWPQIESILRDLGEGE